MGVYISKSTTKDGRQYFFKVQYFTSDSPDPKTKVSKKYATKEEAEHEEKIFVEKMDKFKDPNYRKKEMMFYTLNEFNDFISVEDELLYKCYFSLIYFCGLRCGESRAIQWSDLNFTTNIISITKQVQLPPKDYAGDEKFLIMPPKTRTSNRRIPMCNRLVNLLLEYKSFLEENNIYDKSAFVFSMDQGSSPISEYTIWKRKKRNCKLSGIKEIRLHDFRHSCASLLVNKGANVQVVAKYLGHTKVEETLKTYSHLFTSTLDEVVAVIDNLDNNKTDDN